MSLKTSKTSCLISLHTNNVHSFEMLKKAIQKIEKFCEVLKLSSVYKVNLENKHSQPEIHAINVDLKLEALLLIIKVLSPQSEVKLNQKLTQLSQQLSSPEEQRSIYFQLLAFGSLSLMKPGLTLPHPELYSSDQLLIPSAEIWPEYRHPVLNEKLCDLAKRKLSSSWGEFYAQGKSLLDFSISRP